MSQKRETSKMLKIQIFAWILLPIMLVVGLAREFVTSPQVQSHLMWIRVFDLDTTSSVRAGVVSNPLGRLAIIATDLFIADSWNAHAHIVNGYHYYEQLGRQCVNYRREHPECTGNYTGVSAQQAIICIWNKSVWGFAPVSDSRLACIPERLVAQFQIDALLGQLAPVQEVSQPLDSLLADLCNLSVPSEDEILKRTLVVVDR